jgi:hypothetical protein
MISTPAASRRPGRPAFSSWPLCAAGLVSIVEPPRQSNLVRF